MTRNDTGDMMKFRVLLLASVLLVAGLSFLMNYFGDRKTEAVVKAQAEEIVAHSSPSVFAGGIRPAVRDRIRARGIGARYGFVFSASAPGGGEESGALLFAVPIMDNCGPILSVFYFSPESGTAFLGTCFAPSQARTDFRAAGGAGEESGNPAHPGPEISPGILRNWTDRIGKAAESVWKGGFPR